MSVCPPLQGFRGVVPALTRMIVPPPPSSPAAPVRHPVYWTANADAGRSAPLASPAAIKLAVTALLDRTLRISVLQT